MLFFITDRLWTTWNGYNLWLSTYYYYHASKFSRMQKALRKKGRISHFFPTLPLCSLRWHHDGVYVLQKKKKIIALCWSVDQRLDQLKETSKATEYILECPWENTIAKVWTTYLKGPPTSVVSSNMVPIKRFPLTQFPLTKPVPELNLKNELFHKTMRLQ